MDTLNFSSLDERAGREEAERWFAVNDGVMGGESLSGFRVVEGEGRFAGETSLENGGGFASVRRRPGAFEQALAGAGGMTVRAWGDGRTYQLRLKSRALDEGSAYRVAFTPAAGEWRSYRFDWADFEAVRRGTRLSDAPPLAAADIYQLGLLIADRQAGEFCLRVERLDAVR